MDMHMRPLFNINKLLIVSECEALLIVVLKEHQQAKGRSLMYLINYTKYHDYN